VPKTFILIVIVIVIAIHLAFAPPLSAERPAGTLTGRITDMQGFPLPGAFVYVSSSTLLGVENYITSDTGRFYFLRLFPGLYRMSIDMPGFKTIHINDIRIRAGKAVSLSVRMEATDIEEEITQKRPSPMLDALSPKRAFWLDRDVLTRLPGPRDLTLILGLIPGFVGDAPRDPKSFAVFGSATNANTWIQDGFNLTDPATASPMMPLNIDLIEEIQVVTTALPAEAYPGEGAFINILTRPGGSRFKGELSVFHTGQGLSQSFWSDEDLTRVVNAPSEADKNFWDASLSMGGSLMADRAWFFSNARLTFRSQDTPFNTRWQDPGGSLHQPYDWSARRFSGFFRLRIQATSDFLGFAEVGINRHSQPIYERDVAFRTPEAATRNLDGEKLFYVSGGVTHIMDQNTFVDMKAGYAEYSRPLLVNRAGQNAPRYEDLSTGAIWGSGFINDISDRRRFQAGATLVHIQENLIGAHHEIKAGGDYEDISSDRTSWKEDNLLLFAADGSPYFYGSGVSPATGAEVGKGLVGFLVTGAERGNLFLRSEVKRLGFFLQDTLTFAGRVSLSLGMRFDRSEMRFPAATKGPAAREASLKTGLDLIQPVIGLNPFDRFVVPEWEGVVIWNTLSPRAGLNVDLSSSGTAMLKASFSRYPEYLSPDIGRFLHPLGSDRFHRFTWYDENRDGVVDASDTFALQDEDFRIYSPGLFKTRVANDASAPHTEEWAVGLHGEIFKDFSMSVGFINKSRRNILGSVLFDPDSGREWYNLNPYTLELWVPFSTVVPGVDDYPDTSVTVYMPSQSAPSFFERIQNIPELERSFRGLEFVFRKRMSNNWQFYGSLVWGKSTGNADLNMRNVFFHRTTWTPNAFVNRPGDSLLDLDRPFVIKLLGTVRLPLKFDLTLYFHHIGGTPWARTVTIVPPDSWSAQTGAKILPVTVFLEKPGTRRHSFYETLDLRLEKTLALGRQSSLRVFIDGLNLLGNTYGLINGDDGGLWFPDTENSAAGRRVLSPTYKMTLDAYGTRVVQLGLGLRF
jgi:hypothetical protein